MKILYQKNFKNIKTKFIFVEDENKETENKKTENKKTREELIAGIQEKIGKNILPDSLVNGDEKTLNKANDILEEKGDLLDKVNDVLQNPKMDFLEEIAKHEEYFHGKDATKNFREGLLKNLEKKLHITNPDDLKKLEPFLDQEILTNFYKKVQKEHNNFCDDKEPLEKEFEVLTLKFHDNKSSAEFWKQEFKNTDDFLKKFSEENPEFKERLKNYKGKRKQKIFEKLKTEVPRILKINEKIREKQIIRKLEKIDNVLKNLSEEVINSEEIIPLEKVEETRTKRLHELSLFKNLPDKYRKELDKKLTEKLKKYDEEMAFGFVEFLSLENIDINDEKNVDEKHFMKNYEQFFKDSGMFFKKEIFSKISNKLFPKLKKLHQEWLENHHEEKPEISRKNIKNKWDNFKSELNNFDQDFAGFSDFKNSFIKTQFGKNPLEAEKYFDEHPNFAKAFQTSFENYQTLQTENLNKSFEQVINKISDEKMKRGMRKSFLKSPDNKNSREWIKYLEKNVPLYEKSLKNITKKETKITEELKNKNLDQKKIIDNKKLFEEAKKSFESKKASYDEEFISPRNYEKTLDKILENLQIEGEKKPIKNKKEIVKNKQKIKDIKISDLNLAGDFFGQNSFNGQDFFRENLPINKEIWEDIKNDFNEKSKKLFSEYKKIRKEIKNLENSFNKINLNDLDQETEFKDLKSFAHQPKFMEIFKKIGISDSAYDNAKSSIIAPKVAKLFAHYLKSKKDEKNLDEDYVNIDKNKLKETKNQIKNLKIESLDLQKDFNNLDNFKNQPKIKNITDSISPEILEFVKDDLEIKAVELFAEHLKIRSEVLRTENALKNIKDGDFDTNFKNWEEFKEQPKIREFFKKLNISDIAFDTSKYTLIKPKFQEIWANRDENNNPEKDNNEKENLLKIGSKYGLNFHNVRLENIENLEQKLDRFDQLCKISQSFVDSFRYNEQDLVPFFLDFMGEMNNTEFDKLKNELDQKSRTPSEIYELFLSDNRRSFLAKESKRKNYFSWNRLNLFDQKNKESSLQKMIIDGVAENDEKEIKEIDELKNEEDEKNEEIKNDLELEEIKPENNENLIKEKFEINSETTNEKKENEKDGDDNFSEEDKNLKIDENQELEDTVEINEEENFELKDDEISDEKDDKNIRENSENEGKIGKDKEEDKEEEDTEIKDDTGELKKENKTLETEQNEIIEKDDENSEENKEEFLDYQKEKINEKKEIKNLEDETKSAQNFAEIYVSTNLKLIDLIFRIEQYLSILKNKEQKINTKITKKYLLEKVQNSREFFLEIITFLFDKNLEKIVFEIKEKNILIINLKKNHKEIKFEFEKSKKME